MYAYDNEVRYCKLSVHIQHIVCEVIWQSYCVGLSTVCEYLCLFFEYTLEDKI